MFWGYVVKPILVQMSEHIWTMQAVHLACAIARNNQSEVVLLRMIPVTHPSYLGTSYGSAPLTSQERQFIDEYTATAEDYQVVLSVKAMQYVTALDAVMDAAELLDVDIVFANVPQCVIPYWQRFRTWMLERHLAAQHRRLYTLTNGKLDADQVPFVVNTPSHSHAAHGSAS